MLMKTKLVIFLLSIMTVVTSCYDETDPVAEIITPTDKGFYPVSANTFVDLINTGTITANRAYKPGVNIRFELQYWSEGVIKEVNLYRTEGAGPREKIYTGAYSEIKAFSRLKSADTLLFDYTTPMVAVTTSVKLEVEIVNENTLSLIRSLTLQSKP